MRRNMIQRLATRCVVAVGVCTMAMASDALAGSYGSWGSSGGWGGSSSSGGSSSGGSSSSGGWGGSSGSWGGSSSSGGGWGRHRAHRHHAHGSSGSWGGSSSGGGSSSSGGWSGSSSSGGSGSSGGWHHSTPYEGHIEYESAPPEAPEAPAPPTNSTSFELELPADAKVYVNDKLTTSTGTKRQYVSRNLVAGRTYTFNVRVELEQDGEIVARNETIRLTSGKSTQLAIDFSKTASEEAVAEKKAETKLTLAVPADAKVYLAGRLTSTPGAVRDFTTTRLAEGTQWENYVVRVTVERDGEVLVKEEKLTLVGGSSREFSFDFEDSRVALADR